MAAVEGQLLIYARARIDPADVEDVVAETLVRFLLQVRSDARINNALSLLFTILKNRIVDRLRRKKLVESVSDDELLSLQAARFAPVPGADDEAISRIELNRILAQVPEPERVVLYLRHVYDLSVQEVATRTGLSVDQVKKRTAEGIRHLKEVIYR
jgi:RNA polymerase sigma-70 factor (ECF subfamily)